MSAEPTPRRSLFAVWHWPRWPWAVVAMVMPVVYQLSAAPVIYFRYRYEFDVPDRKLTPAERIAVDSVETFYYPASRCKVHSSILRSIWLWELETMSELFEPSPD